MTLTLTLRCPAGWGSREKELEAVELGKRLNLGHVERSAQAIAHRQRRCSRVRGAVAAAVGHDGFHRCGCGWGVDVASLKIRDNELKK